MEEIDNDLRVWIEEIVSIMKALGNQTRLKVLSLLLQKKQSFQSLMASTNLKKTALSNHLNKLVNNGLIVRSDHGIYKITSDGKLFVQANVASYKRSDHRKEQIKSLNGLKMSNIFIQSFLKKKQ
ncbi:MAG: ArsR/SmtB family transcription factor [Promethearchaeota archaeon]